MFKRSSQSLSRLTLLGLLLIGVHLAFTQEKLVYSTLTPQNRELLWSNLKNNESKTAVLSKDTAVFSALMLRWLNDESNPEQLLEYGLWLKTSVWWHKITRRTRAEILSLTAENHAALGQYKEAIVLYNEILSNFAAELKRMPELYVLVLLELANNYGEFGHQSLVVDLVQKALDVCHAYPREVKLNDFLTAYNNLLYYEFNEARFLQFKKARFGILNALVANNESAKNYLEVIYRKYEIFAYLELGDYDAVVEKIKSFELLRMDNGQENQRKFSYLLSIYPKFIALLINREEDFARAGREIENYFNVSQKVSSPGNEMHALSIRAHVEHKLGKYSSSLATLQQVLDNYEVSSQSYSYYSIVVFKAYNRVLNKDFRHAEKELDACMHLFVENYLEDPIALEKIGSHNFNEINNGTVLSFFSLAAVVYAKIFETNRQKSTGVKAEAFSRAASQMFVHNYSQGEFDESLALIHQRIAEAMLTLICTKYNKDKNIQLEFLNLLEKNASTHIFKEFQKQLIQTLPNFRNLYFQQKQLENNIAVLKLDLLLQENQSLEKRLSDKLDSLQIIEQSLQNALGGFYNLRNDFQVEQVLDELQNDEQIIKYYAASEHLYRVGFHLGEVVVDRLGENEALRSKVMQYAELLRDPLSHHHILGKELCQMLLPQSSAKHQILISERYLHYLNFETLLDENGQFLLAKKNFSYHPTLPFWYATRFYPKTTNPRKIVCFTANYDPKSGLAPLKFASKEVDEILKIIPGKHIREATAASFETEVGAYAVAHLAMHALLPEQQNEPSRLVFSNNEEINFSQIYTMNLPLEMMVLSACNTGFGRIKNGEGLMSLSRALMLSGVRSNVVSLWPAADETTQEIMVEFYQNLKNGAPKDEALAESKRKYLSNNPLKTHPYFWGSFILNGDTAPIFEPTSRWIPPLAWSLFALLLTGMGIRYYRRSFNKRSADS